MEIEISNIASRVGVVRAVQHKLKRLGVVGLCTWIRRDDHGATDSKPTIVVKIDGGLRPDIVAGIKTTVADIDDHVEVWVWAN